MKKIKLIIIAILVFVANTYIAVSQCLDPIIPESINMVTFSEDSKSLIVSWTKDNALDSYNFKLFEFGESDLLYKELATKKYQEDQYHITDTTGINTLSFFSVATYNTCSDSAVSELAAPLLLIAPETENESYLIWTDATQLPVKEYYVYEVDDKNNSKLIDTIQQSETVFYKIPSEEVSTIKKYRIAFKLEKSISIPSIPATFEYVKSNIVTVYVKASEIYSQTPNDVSVDISDGIQDVPFTSVFSYSGTESLYYDAFSSNSAVVDVITTKTGFSFIPYGKGEAVITLKAYAGDKIKEETFLITVTDETGIACNRFIVASKIKQVTCFGGNDGSIFLEVTGGGTAPYNFRWQNTRTDNALKQIKAGDYEVLIFDAAGCSELKTYTIFQPEPIYVGVEKKLPLCGESDGACYIYVSGGTGTYKMLWSNGDTDDVIEKLSTGIYTVSITDEKMCKHREVIAIDNENAPVISIDEIVSAPCHKKEGSVAISVTGGSEPYSYLWNDGKNIEDRTAVLPGVYSLSVTDNSKCVANIVAVIPFIPAQENPICAVTVSESKNKNIVAWEKLDDGSVVKYYTIYKENENGIFDSIASLNYADAGIFIDYKSNPTLNSSRYRLTATDYCGNETSFSSGAEHKTINLTLVFDEATNEVLLYWDNFEGHRITNFKIYTIDKYNNKRVQKMIPATRSEISLGIVDPNIVGFYVEAEFAAPCDPLGLLKSDSGPFSQSLSNIAEAQLSDLPKIDKTKDVIIFPNPAETTLNYYLATIPSGFYSVSVIDSKGVAVISKIESLHDDTLMQIDINSLSKGKYSLVISNKNVRFEEAFIKK
ncbi:MAG: T9SS type A sorting domain-containing protein [Bacteroidales bacterium]|nr:T9SS type A sorting domain-containing protein [Bacteroidales bacterium]